MSDRTDMRTGGPAFPSLNPTMTGIDSDGTERWETEPCGGMDLRDYFAAKAMQANLAVIREFPDEHWRMGLALDAYMMADAMIAARNAA